MIGDVAGTSILELFAGSGAFSIEAMSRGAASATCVEIDGRVCRLLKKNAIAAGIAKGCLVINMDVRYALLFSIKEGKLRHHLSRSTLWKGACRKDHAFTYRK
jgi:16S rRNA G966 N2-methylase RsmD